LQHNLSRIDELAETVAREAANNGLTASQLRNFYGPITKVRIDSNPTRQRAALKMHRSRLAYLVARSGGKADELWRWFGDLLRRANDPTEISGVCDFAEAIVAYHRYYDKTKGGTRDE
jgi:CRISPR type III-A-associated protein Csm2